MPLFGAHLSAAGGPHRALEAAAAFNMQACQLFTKNNQQWRAAPLTVETLTLFAQTRQRLGIQCVLAHASYLLNLASKNDDLWEKSILALADELHRANQLQLAYLVIHPGTASDDDHSWALRRIATAIDASLRQLPRLRTKLLLETTAGQGRSLGHKFSHLGEILGRVRRTRSLGVCLDSCHVFAAGYPLADRQAYRRTMREFAQEIGVEQLHVLHLNDSIKPLGSRVDRHAHIGHGQIGLEGFCNLVNDPQLHNLPMILETPKGLGPDNIEWDTLNLKQLRDLCKSKR